MRWSAPGIEPGEVEEVVLGCANPEGATGGNIARQAALRAGLPAGTAAMTVNRFCSSGLQAVAIAANRVVCDGVPVAVAGGLESISLVQTHAEPEPLPRRLARCAHARRSTCR